MLTCNCETTEQTIAIGVEGQFMKIFNWNSNCCKLCRCRSTTPSFWAFFHVHKSDKKSWQRLTKYIYVFCNRVCVRVHVLSCDSVSYIWIFGWQFNRAVTIFYWNAWNSNFRFKLGRIYVANTAHLIKLFQFIEFNRICVHV